MSYLPFHAINCGHIWNSLFVQNVFQLTIYERTFSAVRKLLIRILIQTGNGFNKKAPQHKTALIRFIPHLYILPYLHRLLLIIKQKCSSGWSHGGRMLNVSHAVLAGTDLSEISLLLLQSSNGAEWLKFRAHLYALALEMLTTSTLK